MPEKRVSVRLVASGGNRVRAELEGIGDAGKRGMGQLSREIDITNARLAAFVRRAQSASVAAVAAFSAAAIARGIAQQRTFGNAIAEVSTLLSGETDEIDRIEAASRRLARTYGVAAQDQARAFYQAISAGAGGAAQAAHLLDVANRLAIGGVTDVTTGVDILTTAINAYGKGSLSAADASDILFTGMRAGKTTIGELAGTLGNVVSLAAKTGVAFDELVAGVAALTTQGIATSEAVTGLRGVLAAILKPTQEAREEADRLGIAFSTARLKQLGLAGFFQEVIKATKGSETSLAKLFGRVEALNAVLAGLSGTGGETFLQILQDMENRAGATGRAFDRMAREDLHRLNVALKEIDDRFLDVGAAALTVVTPAIESVAKYFDGLVAAGGALAVTLSVQVTSALIGTTTAAARAATAAMLALRVSMLAIPHLAIAAGVAYVVNHVRGLSNEVDSLNAALARLSTLEARAAILQNELSGSVLSTMEGLARAQGEKNAIAFAESFARQIAERGEQAQKAFWNQFLSPGAGNAEAALQAFGFADFARQAEAAGVSVKDLRRAFEEMAANSVETERRAGRFMFRALKGLQDLQEETGLSEAALRSFAGTLEDLQQAGGARDQFAALERLREVLTQIDREGLTDIQVYKFDALLDGVVTLQDRVRPLAELLGDPDEATRKVFDLEQAMRALTNAAGDLPSVNPVSGKAAEHLRSELEFAARAHKKLAQADAARSIVATADAARALAGQLGLTVEQASDYEYKLARIGQDDSFGQQARALADVLAYLEASTGGAAAVDKEARAIYGSLLKALGVAISFESALSGAGDRMAQLAAAANAGLAQAQLQIEYRSDPAQLARQISLAQSQPVIDESLRRLADEGASIDEIAERAAAWQKQAVAIADTTAKTARLNEQLSALGGASRDASKGVSQRVSEAERWIERTRTASERLADELRDLAELNELGFFGEHPQAYARAIALVNEEFAKSEYAAFYEGIESIADALAGAIVKGEDLGESFSRILQQMAMEIISSNIKGLLQDMFNPGGGGAGGSIGGFVTSLLSGALGGGRTAGSNIPVPKPRPSVLHDGGIAGLSGHRRRLGEWPGLRPHEVPAILERGERVLNRRETAQYGRLSGQAVLRIEAPDGFSVEQMGQIGGIAIKITKTALKQYDSNVAPERVDQIIQDPRRRD